MTTKEKIICECYTGVCFTNQDERKGIAKYLSEKLGREVDEYALYDKKERDNIVFAVREDFLNMLKKKGRTTNESQT